MGEVNKWTEEEKEFLLKNNFTMSHREIGKELGRSPSAVQQKSRQLGLKHKSQYYYNKQYFYNIDTPEKAYWLGFLAADGWVIYNTSRRNFELGVELKSTDINHLRKLNKSLEGNVEPILTKGKPLNIGTQKPTMVYACKIRIYSKELVTGLMQNGVIPNKTYEGIEIPSLSDELMWMYILGFYDGDGFISFPKGESKYGYRLGLCSADLNVLETFKKFFESKGMKIGSITIDSFKEEAKVPNYKMDIRNRDSVKTFIDNTYKKSSVYLDRKYDNYLKLDKWLS